MDQIRTLLWLKLRFSLALYRKRRSLLAILLFSLPISLAFNLGLFFGGLVAFWSLPLENNRQLLNGGLTALYLMWLLGPLLGVSLNEGYDISKLLVYPISGRRIFIANILGSILDPPVLALLIPLSAIPIGLGSGPLSAMLMTAVVLVFLFHTLSLSQALMTLLWGLLKSRRIADVWKVFVALAGTIFWISYQVAMRRVDNVAPALLTAQPGRYTRFLPSGLAADAIAALHDGVTTDFAWRFCALVVICLGTVALAGGLVHRVASGDLILDRVGQKPPPKRKLVRKTRRGTLGLGITTFAVFQNELRTYIRDPQAKVELLQRAGGLVAIPIIMASSAHSNISVSDIRNIGAFSFLGPMGAMVLMILMMSSNVLARDRGGLSLLFAMPASRESMLRGKNLAIISIFSPLAVLVILVVAVFVKDWGNVFPALLITECLMLISIAEGNVFSVYNPSPLPEKGRNPYSSNKGCSMFGMLGAMAGFLVLLVVASPLVPAFLVPAKWVSPIWYLLTLPAAMAYTLAVYIVVTRWAARALVRREPEVLHTILRLPG